MSAGYQRGDLLEMGLDVQDIEKAERHFGKSITTEKAVDWIFNGCPGYNPSASAAASTAVGPFNAAATSSGATTTTDGTGWDTLEPLTGQNAPKSGWDEDYDSPEGSAAKALTAVRGNDAGLNAEGYARHPVQDMGWPQDTSRGTTGRSNTPVDQLGPGKDSNMPIDLTQETSMPPLIDQDDELQKAIALSKQDHGGQSQAMSRQQSSKSRQQQEEDEMAQALSMSMVDMRASGMSVQSEHPDLEAEAALLEVRQDVDRPMALITPPSTFLSYLPNLIHCFYYNLPFRNALFGIEFFESTDEPLLEDYARGKARTTREILQERWKPDPVHPDVIRLAALQRLFVFMTSSKRTRTSLADFMDAFKLDDGTKAIMRPPLQDMRQLHDQICAAWVTVLEGAAGASTDIASQVRFPDVPFDGKPFDSALIERLKSTLYWRGVQLGGSELQYLQSDPPPEFLEGQPPMDDSSLVEGKQSMAQQGKSQWIPYVEVTSYAPEVNDTYTALDNSLVQATAQTKAFLHKPSDSLYIYNSRTARPTTQQPAATQIGPVRPTAPVAYGSADSLANRKPFQISPSLYLDRYDWSQRGAVEKLRDEQYLDSQKMGKLAAQQAKLGVYNKTGQEILSVQTSDVEKALDSGDKKKALLEKTLAHLKHASELEEDEKRKVSQLALLDRLTKVAEMLREQIAQLQARLDQLRNTQTARWDSLSKTVGPYELRSVLMWRGLPGRESTYVYVQSGTASASLGLDDDTVEHKKWWRITDTLVEEVSEDAVLSDPTGMHMYNGGGSVLHGYVQKDREELAEKEARLPHALLSAVNLDNAELERAIVGKQSSGGSAEQSAIPEVVVEPSRASSTDAVMDPSESQGAATQVGTDEDVQMGSESQETGPLQVRESSAPLRLSGGSTVPRRPRRSSVTSDTGSIASTSKVKIGDEEDVDDSDDEGEVLVELGFAEKLNKKGFKVVKDVGKIGGKPTWLNPALPLKIEQTTCKVCEARMEFVLQINAPLDNNPAAIYRTFYVYSCTKASCLAAKAKESVKVFRVQLPAGNPFYEVEKPEDQSLLQRFRDKQYLNFCPTCKMQHEQPCHAKPWQEWVIDTGPEELDADGDPANTNDIESTLQSATLSNEDGTQDAKEPDTKVPVDAAFLQFQERMHNEPDQVLRYYYRETAEKAGPLWVSDEKKLAPEDVPACRCGARRVIEFQILSTILSYLGVNDLEKDSLDFGTIAIYTCEASCSSTPPPPFEAAEEAFQQYAPAAGWEEEVAYVQNYSLKGVEFRHCSAG